ncbi:alanine racemase [Paenibacillus tarimensis]
MPDTPCVIINTGKMHRNIEKLAGISRKYGVSLRPHMKTHKIPAIAKRQIAAGACGITAAKISEAEVMAAHGINDIFIAYPLVAESKIERLIALSRRVRVIAGVDGAEGAAKLAELAKRRQATVEVRLEVDTGLQRTGVRYDDAVGLARKIAALPQLRLRGIYTFRGAFMNGQSTLDARQAGLEEGRMMVELAERIRAVGIEIPDVSVGSTPTSAYAAEVDGVTEIRPGTYVFYDRMQAALNACTLDDCAAAVRVTVVSRPAEDRIVIDGGSKTFATDVAPGVAPLYLQGFGHIVEAPHAVIERLSEEHGMVRIAKGDAFGPGDVLHVIPNHICSTINLHNKVYFRESNGEFKERQVIARGMVY